MSMEREVRISVLKTDLRKFLRTPQVVVPSVVGPPGVGKSEIVKQLAVEFGSTKKDDCAGCKADAGDPTKHVEGCRAWHSPDFCSICLESLQGRYGETGAPQHIRVTDLRLSTFDPVELKGLPYTDDSGRTRWACPEFFPVNPREYSILFLDEFRCAAQAVQNAALQIVLDRRMHTFPLSPHCAIICAGNTEEDAAFITRLSGPMNNRLAHFRVKASVEDFVEWGRSNNIRTEILGAIENDDAHLLPTKFTKEADAQPTPRTWAMFSRLWDQAGARTDKEIKSLSLPIVGQGATTNFMAFLNLFNVVKPEKIIEEGEMPTFEKDDKDISRRYATACSVSNYIRRNQDKFNKEKQVVNLFKFLSLVNTELRVKTIRDIGLADRPKAAALILKHATSEYKEIVNKLSKALSD